MHKQSQNWSGVQYPLKGKCDFQLGSNEASTVSINNYLTTKSIVLFNLLIIEDKGILCLSNVRYRTLNCTRMLIEYGKATECLQVCIIFSSLKPLQINILHNFNENQILLLNHMVLSWEGDTPVYGPRCVEQLRPHTHVAAP